MNRDINLSDIRLELTEPNRLYVKVGKFDILINHTHEGVIIDVFPWVDEDSEGYSGDALATLAVADEDADDALGKND